MKIKILFFTVFLIVQCTGSDIKNVRIKLDKETVVTGGVITARLYVSHKESTVPAYHIVRELDTARLAIDFLDNNCGVFRAAYKSPGKKEINGFVEFLDKQDIKQSLNFTFKFEVVDLPENLPDEK
jgi:hypothetical protein